MSHKEFDSQKWKQDMACSYNDGISDSIYHIRSVNFRERLLGLLPIFLSPMDAEADQVLWVRCEHCELRPNRVS